MINSTSRQVISSTDNCPLQLGQLRQLVSWFSWDECWSPCSRRSSWSTSGIGWWLARWSHRHGPRSECQVGTEAARGCTRGHYGWERVNSKIKFILNLIFLGTYLFQFWFFNLHRIQLQRFFFCFNVHILSRITQTNLKKLSTLHTQEVSRRTQVFFSVA